MAADFPEAQSAEWIQYKHGNENKLGLSQRVLFPPSIRAVVDELNSPPFVAWLSELTGIANLIADSSLDGGGLHQVQRGGFLNVHTDFSVHHYRSHWQRRVNLILYLTPDWRDEWGGALEFWDPRMSARASQYYPRLNHAVIFNTDGQSLHGKGIAQEPGPVLLHVEFCDEAGGPGHDLPRASPRWMAQVGADSPRYLGSESLFESETAFSLFRPCCEQIARTCFSLHLPPSQKTLLVSSSR
jgi:hypothetical protein